MKLQLEQIRQVERNLLRHFSDVCKQNNITFWLSNGTLLGAVKYKGFIPWDDDVDVLVLREDYDRLIKIYTDTDQFMLLSPERNDAYLYPFAKLCDKNTILKEINYDNGVQLGVNMDIFPLDVLAHDYARSCKHVQRNKSLIKILGFSRIIQYMPHESRNKAQILLRHGALLLCRIIGAKQIRDQMIRNARKYGSEKRPKYVGCALWPVYADGEVMLAEVFHQTKYLMFENDMYPVPNGYDTYLRGLYGDYVKDPPIEKQVTHHSFEVYWRDV